MSVRKSAASNGSSATQQRARKRRDSCVHHWIQENTRYPVYEPKVGQVNLGRTRGRCKKCGETRRWESATPDSVYGIESIISFNIRLENDTLPEGFGLEEDYDA